MRKDYAKLKGVALAWKNAAPRLRAIRHADIRRQDNALAIESLNTLFRQAIRDYPPANTSGLVEMNRLRRRQSNG